MKTFATYIVVGLINTAVGYGIIFAALGIGAGYWTATVLGTVIGMAVSFTLNKRVTFQHSGKGGGPLLRFAAAGCFCYIIAYPAGRAGAAFLSPIWKMALGGYVSEEQAAVVFGASAYTLLNYAAMKRFVFPEEANTAAESAVDSPASSDKYSRGNA